RPGKRHVGRVTVDPVVDLGGRAAQRPDHPEAGRRADGAGEEGRPLILDAWADVGDAGAFPVLERVGHISIKVDPPLRAVVKPIYHAKRQAEVIAVLDVAEAGRKRQPPGTPLLGPGEKHPGEVLELGVAPVEDTAEGGCALILYRIGFLPHGLLSA